MAESTSNFTNSPEIDIRIELAVSVFEYLFCIVGLSANLIVCSTILRYKKTTFSNSFYTLALALAVPDCVHLCSELFCALPAVFYGLEKTPKVFLNTCGYFADVSFWAIAPLMLVIAVNRYVAVCQFQNYKRYFTPKRVKFLITFCFVFCFFNPSILYGCKCYYDYNYAWLFVCDDHECKDFALNWVSTMCNTICLIIAGIYVKIYIQHRKVQRQVGATLQQNEDDKRRRAKESKLMFQFGLISTVLIAYQIFFWIFMFLAQNGPSEMVLNFIVNLNSCISPFLYLSFGSEIRSRLPWRKNINSAQTISAIATAPKAVTPANVIVNTGC